MGNSLTDYYLIAGIIFPADMLVTSRLENNFGLYSEMPLINIMGGRNVAAVNSIATLVYYSPSLKKS